MPLKLHQPWWTLRTQDRQIQQSSEWKPNRKPKVGDVVFAHSNGIVGRLIRFAEFLRWRRGSHWNHACIVSRIENGVAYVIQADIRGVNEAPLSSVGEYFLMDPPGSRAKLVEFHRAQIAAKSNYGLLSILSIMFDILSPNFCPDLRRPNTWICSAVTAEGLRYAGWLHTWSDIYTVTPSALWSALNN
jgi:hypothetical protein